MKRRVPVLAIVTVAVISATYVKWSPSGRAAPSAAPTSDALLAQSAKVGRGETSRLTDDLERQVADQPTASGLKFLAQLYLQRGKLSGDVATYGQAKAALEKAIQLAPGDNEAPTLLASVLATTHDFSQAADLARTVLREHPDDIGAAAVLGDSQLELGDYQGAGATYDGLAAQQGDAAAVIVRQARYAFLTGHVEQARELARQAKQQAVASAFGDVSLAFYTTFQGQVEHDTGHYAAAEKFYRRALKEAPGYYIALAGLGRELAAQGHFAEAIASYRQAVATVPQPDAVAALGDLLKLTHQDSQAQEQYNTVGVIASLAAINQQVYNRALATYDADHDVNAAQALALASTELQVRRDVYGYDIDAWALYKNKQYGEAKQAATKALALGTPDAKLLYHAGMINAALGDAHSASDELRRALQISPQFDPLQAPIARSTLAGLEHSQART